MKCTESDNPIKRFRPKVIIDHCDIIGKSFWEKHQHILKCSTKKRKSTSANKIIRGSSLVSGGVIAFACWDDLHLSQGFVISWMIDDLSLVAI